MTQAQLRERPRFSEEFSIPAALCHPRQYVETPYQKFLGKGSRFLARNFAMKKLPLRNTRPMISFTFDDVPASACDTGARILEDYHARGTFYIAGAGCNKISPVGLLASIDQLRTIWRRGHEIGCQTYLHSAVSRLNHDELESEYLRNQSTLRMIDDKIAVRNFAYPYGDLAFGARRFLESRFDSCRSVDHGINHGTAALGVLRSWELENATVDRAKITSLIAETIEKNGWLVFLSHDVTNQPSRFGVRPDLLDFAVGAARRSGCQILTVNEALRAARGTTAGDAK